VGNGVQRVRRDGRTSVEHVRRDAFCGLARRYKEAFCVDGASYKRSDMKYPSVECKSAKKSVQKCDLRYIRPTSRIPRVVTCRHVPAYMHLSPSGTPSLSGAGCLQLQRCDEAKVKGNIDCLRKVLDLFGIKDRTLQDKIIPIFGDVFSVDRIDLRSLSVTMSA
jgi:hypothetical protein